MCRDVQSRLAGRASEVFLFLFLLLASTLSVSGPSSQTRLHAGDVPPEALGVSADGQKVRLSACRGKVVIVSFWASWCPPCRKELPVLALIQKQATRDRVAVFAVNFGESASVFRQLVKQLKDVDLTLISDEDGHLADVYGVKSIPNMFIIGRDGQIAAVHVGYGEEEIPVLAKEINALLAVPAQEPVTASRSGAPGHPATAEPGS